MYEATLDLESQATLSTQLGRFAAETQYDRLPGAVVDAVKLRVLDVLAASCAGVQAGNQRGLLALLPGDGPIGIWGTTARLPLRDAAMINSAVAHSTYFEDGSRYTGGHPSSALIPAAMALAQARGASGRTLIAAVAAGYEVFLRLGRAIYPSTVRRGFQSTAILAAPATAAAAAVLLDLSPERAAHAIAIACSHGAGLKEALKSADSQPLQVGRSSEGGLLSALFAAQGATGAPNIVEQGFLKAFAQDADSSSIGLALGAQWHIEETYMKAHGGCRGNHAPIDAASALIRGEAGHAITVDRIESIDVKVDTVTLAAEIADPLNADQAQFSVAFSIAVMLVTGDATPMRFTDALLADPAVRDLMRRTRVQVDTALDAGYPDRRPAVVTFVLKDGRSMQFALDHAKGEPENPMTQADIERKFAAVADPLYGSAAPRIRDFVLLLESLPTLDGITALLVPDGTANRAFS